MELPPDDGVKKADENLLNIYRRLQEENQRLRERVRQLEEALERIHAAATRP